MKLIIMRHSECWGLDKSIINGWRDFNLTSKGKVQVKDVAKELKNICNIEKVDEIYSSYLNRAIDTARIVGNSLSFEKEIKKDIRLNERHYGFFQGMTRQEARKYKEYNSLSISHERLDNRLIPLTDEMYNEQLEEYSKKLNVLKEKLADKLPRCESILDVEQRVIEFFEEKIFIQYNIDKIILVVGHANTVKLMTKYIEKLNYEQTSKLRFAPCGMKIYDIDYMNNEYVVQSIKNINKEWKNNNKNH